MENLSDENKSSIEKMDKESIHRDYLQIIKYIKMMLKLLFRRIQSKLRNITLYSWDWQ